jgi:hypothetical protein
MFDANIDGRLQVTAGISLLEFSRLVQWDPEFSTFVPKPREVFERSWYETVDPVFGRLICWINFSAGAEFLSKGVCLLHGVEIRRNDEVPLYPTSDLATWVTQFHRFKKAKLKSFGAMETTNFGTLSNLVYPNSITTKPAFEILCEKVSATDGQRELLLAAYKLLAATIRNRDSHAYVPNVRDGHFLLVPDLFTRCFNLLVSWLPGGPAIVNRWRDKDDALQFVAKL